MQFNVIFKNPYFSLVKSIWHWGTPWKKSIITYYVTFTVAQISISLIPYTFGKAIDALQNGEAANLKLLIYWLAFGVILLGIFWLLHGPARIMERRIALRIQQSYRLKIYEQLTHLPLKWHQEHHSGNVITRINRSSQALHRFAETQFIYIETLIRFVAAVGFLLWISLPIGLMSLSFSIVVISAVVLFDKRLIPLYAAKNEIENHIGAVLFDYISNMTTVLTLRLGDLTRNNLSERMSSVWRSFNKEVVLNEKKWFSMMMLLSIIQPIILVGYVFYSLNTEGFLLIGTVIMISRYQGEVNSVFNDLSIHLGEIVRLQTDVESMQPILEDIERLAHLPLGAATARKWHNLAIKQLAFYHTAGNLQRPIFKDVEFEIKRGEKIALIGLSGGGKSTLLNLLGGLYSPFSVQLIIDEKPFDSLEPLRTITTLIPQDPEIFENSVGFNITLDLPAEKEEIQRAINLASFDKVLKELPAGLATNICEKGLNFSVGQKQRLALARGLFAARYSSLILMDEPTSSVDLATEKEILLNIIKTFPEAAMIISLHRLHLLPYFDKIILLGEGKVLAAGSARRLLTTSGPIQELWKEYQSNVDNKELAIST